MAQAVLSIPTTAHIAVRYTTLQLIGELCEWIDKHPQVIGKYENVWCPQVAQAVLSIQCLH